jgi:predicted PurR-regulated permease PerM
VYFAFNPKLYSEGIVKLVPQSRERRAREILETMEYTLRRFLLGISASMVINGALTFLGLWFLGVPFAIPLAIIAGLLTFVPNIGPYIAGIPAVLIGFSLSPSQALYVLILYLVVQNLDGLVISPLIQQRAVSIPPVLVIASQLLLAVMFGFLGLLLAVPIVAVVFVLVKMIYVEDILGRRVEVKGEREAKKEVVSEVANNE